MGSGNDGHGNERKAPRRGRLFEVSPPPEAATEPAVLEPESAPVEPLTEPIPPLDPEDVVSIDPAAVAPVDEASEASAKLAGDERMRKPIPAASYAAPGPDRRSRPDSSLRTDPSPLVRRSAPQVGHHPAPRRRGLRWLWAFGPAVLLVAILAGLYFSGYRLGPQGLVPPQGATR
jgi:hypothetical protein